MDATKATSLRISYGRIYGTGHSADDYPWTVSVWDVSVRETAPDGTPNCYREVWRSGPHGSLAAATAAVSSAGHGSVPDLAASGVDGADEDIEATYPGGLSAYRRDESRSDRPRDPETKGMGLGGDWEV